MENNRELEFRAWDEDEKRYVQPDEIYSDNIPVISTKQGFRLSSIFTLKQFTGSLDKNGSKLFNGDRFVLAGRGEFIIDFRSGCFMADHCNNGKNKSHNKDVVIVWHELMESQMLMEKV